MKLNRRKALFNIQTSNNPVDPHYARTAGEWWFRILCHIAADVLKFDRKADIAKCDYVREEWEAWCLEAMNLPRLVGLY